MGKAAKAGNELAKFTLGLILLCQGGENIDKGLKILSPFLTRDSLSTLKQKFRGFRQEIENAWSWWGKPRGKHLKSTYSKRECNCNGIS
ncbi:putative F-box protein [Cardamine amara subsp. amara]|uniref:F-box protein n=1 Tax=Cardamine amara subsp. amara TaxID=228776 RepID=A0ABD0Z155_CARAN